MATFTFKFEGVWYRAATEVRKAPLINFHVKPITCFEAPEYSGDIVIREGRDLPECQGAPVDLAVELLLRLDALEDPEYRRLCDAVCG